MYKNLSWISFTMITDADRDKTRYILIDDGNNKIYNKF